MSLPTRAHPIHSSQFSPLEMLSSTGSSSPIGQPQPPLTLQHLLTTLFPSICLPLPKSAPGPHAHHPSPRRYSATLADWLNLCPGWAAHRAPACTHCIFPSAPERPLPTHILQTSRQQPREEAQLAPDHTPQSETAQGLHQAMCSTVPAPEQSFKGSKEKGRGRRWKKGKAQVSHSAPVKDNWPTTPQDPSQAHFHSKFSIAHCPSTTHRAGSQGVEGGHDRLWCHSASPTPGTKPDLKLCSPRCWSPSNSGFLQETSQRAGPPLPLEPAELLNKAPEGTFQTSKVRGRYLPLKGGGKGQNQD